MALNANDANVTEVARRIGRNKNFGYDTLDFFGKVYVRQQMLSPQNAAEMTCKFFNADQDPDIHLSIEDITELANVSDKQIRYYKDLVDQKKHQPPVQQQRPPMVEEGNPTAQVFEDQETFFSRNRPDESQRGFEEKPMSHFQPQAAKVPQSFDTHTQLLRMVLDNTKQVSPITIDKIANMFELNMAEYQNPYQLYMLLRAFLSPQQADQAFNSFTMAAPKFVINPLTGAAVMQPGMPNNMPVATNGYVNWNMYGQQAANPGIPGFTGQMPYSGMNPGMPVAGMPGFPMPTDPKFAQEMMQEELRDKRRAREREESNDMMQKQMNMIQTMWMTKMSEQGGMGGMGMMGNPMMGMGVEEQYGPDGKTVVARRQIPMGMYGNNQNQGLELVTKMFGDLNNNLMAKVLNPDGGGNNALVDITKSLLLRQPPDPFDQIVKFKQVMGNNMGGGGFLGGGTPTPELLRMQADIQLALEDQWMRFREREREYDERKIERELEDKKMAVWVETFKDVANNSFGPAIQQIASGFASGIQAKQQNAMGMQNEMAMRQMQQRQMIQQSMARPQPQQRQQTIEQRALSEGEIERRKQEAVENFQRQLAEEKRDRMGERLEVENIDQQVTPQEMYAAQQYAQPQRRMPVQQQNPINQAPPTGNPYAPGIISIPMPAGGAVREGDETIGPLPPLGQGGEPLQTPQQSQPGQQAIDESQYAQQSPQEQIGAQQYPQQEQPMTPEEQLMAMRQASKEDLQQAKTEAIKRMIALKQFVDDVELEDDRRDQLLQASFAQHQAHIANAQRLTQAEAMRQAAFNQQAQQYENEMGLGVQPQVLEPTHQVQEVPIQPQDRMQQWQSTQPQQTTNTLGIGTGIGIGGLSREETEEAQRLQELAEIEGKQLEQEAQVQQQSQSQPAQEQATAVDSQKPKRVRKKAASDHQQTPPSNTPSSQSSVQ